MARAIAASVRLLTRRHPDVPNANASASFRAQFAMIPIAIAWEATPGDTPLHAASGHRNYQTLSLPTAPTNNLDRAGGTTRDAFRDAAQQQSVKASPAM